MECNANNATSFLSTTTELMGVNCTGWVPYVIMLTVMFLIRIAVHFINVNHWQKSREILQVEVKNRRTFNLLGVFLLWASLGTFVYLVTITLILSNNLGILIVYFIGDTVGRIWSYSYQRPDNHHMLQDVVDALEKAKKDTANKDKQDLVRQLINLIQAMPIDIPESNTNETSKLLKKSLRWEL
jgi:hypothetical protein